MPGSSDHMPGFSGIAGTGAATGQATQIHGLTGNESNVLNGKEYKVSRGANYRMPVDPDHEFTDILHELCGADISALISLGMPRADAPSILPAPANSAQPLPSFALPAPDVPTLTVTRPAETVNAGNLPGVVHSAMQQDLSVSPGDRASIISRVHSIKTRAQAASYMADVQKKVRSKRAVNAGRG